MSDVPATDAMSQIEDAVMALVRARAPRVKRVLRPENLPAKKGHLPACAVDTGDEVVRYLGADEGGERVIERDVQLDLVIFTDDGIEDARRETRLCVEEVRSAMAEFRAVDLPLDDVRIVSVKPSTMPSEDGGQAVVHLAYLVTFVSRERTPGVIEPRY